LHGIIIFFFQGKGNEYHHLGNGLFVQHRILSVVKTVEFISARISFIGLTGR